LRLKTEKLCKHPITTERIINICCIMKTSNELILKDAIKELLEAYKLTDRLNEAKALKAWEEAAGHVILKYTRSAFIKQGVLYLRIESSVVKNEILLMRNVIIGNINSSLKMDIIKEIVLL